MSRAIKFLLWFSSWFKVENDALVTHNMLPLLVTFQMMVWRVNCLSNDLWDLQKNLGARRSTCIDIHILRVFFCAWNVHLSTFLFSADFFSCVAVSLDFSFTIPEWHDKLSMPTRRSCQFPTTIINSVLAEHFVQSVFSHVPRLAAKSWCCWARAKCSQSRRLVK